MSVSPKTIKLPDIQAALYPLDASALAPEIEVIEEGTGSLPSYFDVSGLAVASIAAVVAEASAYRDLSAAPMTSLFIDRTLASHWFAQTLFPHQWELPPIWDSLAGLYRTQNGWIRLHTNARAHRQAALRVLDLKESVGKSVDKAVVQEIVSGWRGQDLETAIIAAGGCAAQMRSMAEWAEHPQGVAVATEPLIEWQVKKQMQGEVKGQAKKQASASKPFAALRVLDCTRVLAGPVCTRVLAGLGADVLRLDPPDWAEPAVEAEITRGKHCATLDLKTDKGRAVFCDLLRDADVFVHGLRPGALDALGLDAATRQALAPQTIEVSLSAYGGAYGGVDEGADGGTKEGNWSHRRGFDSLVQMSCGIADYGMMASKRDVPTPLPVQALDHATGYLMAASVLRALRVRASSDVVLTARLSLARTAALLMTSQNQYFDAPLRDLNAGDFEAGLQATPWGKARFLKFPVAAEIMDWRRGCCRFHTHEPSWAQN